jgi:tetratricopeptide (TPR) repeat protein
MSAGEPIDTESPEAYSTSASILRILFWFDFGLVMGLAWLGAWVTRERWRTLSLLYAIFGLLAGSVVMFFVLARYRFPLAPIALLFAGTGIVAAAARTRMPRKDWWIACTGAVAIALVLHIPVRTSSDETYVNYGSELLRQGRPAEAVTLLRKAVKEDPSHEDARLSLGLALQKSGDGEGAAEQFRAAIDIDPRSAEARAGLAITLHQQGRTRDAIPYYEEAVRLKPDSVEAMSNLALALNEVGRPTDALVPLERALALQPGNVAVRMNLCQIIAAGRGGDAIRCFEQAVAAAKTPDEILQTQYALAQAQAANGQVAEAVASLERALTSARGSGDVRAIERIGEALTLLRSR